MYRMQNLNRQKRRLRNGSFGTSTSRQDLEVLGLHAAVPSHMPRFRFRLRTGACQASVHVWGRVTSKVPAHTQYAVARDEGSAKDIEVRGMKGDLRV